MNEGSDVVFELGWLKIPADNVCIVFVEDVFKYTTYVVNMFVVQILFEFLLVNDSGHSVHALLFL